MADDPVAKVKNAEAWSEFCGLLEKAGEAILREDLDTTAFDRAEGLRYLTRLLRAGLVSFAERTGRSSVPSARSPNTARPASKSST